MMYPLRPLYFRRFWLSQCVYFFVIVHHLENMDDLALEFMVDFIYFYKISKFGGDVLLMHMILPLKSYGCKQYAILIQKTQ